MSNISKFLDQLNNVEHCNLFITSLTEEDSTLTMFNAQYSERNTLLNEFENSANEEKDYENLSKVNKICSALRHCLILQMESDKKYLISFYTAVLSSFVTEKPSRVAEALSDLKKKLEKSNLFCISV